MEILKNRYFLSILFGTVAFLIIFEAFQQDFYIAYFDLSDGEEVSFWLLLRGQLYRWIIWLLLSIPLLSHIAKTSLRSEDLKIRLFLFYSACIFGLVILNILIISLVQILLSGQAFSWELFGEHIVFYIFQKAPVFTLAYVAITICAHLVVIKQRLETKVLKLSSFKKEHQNLYNELKHRAFSDNTSVLKVKVGNKFKIIPLEDIHWIEADDYCVKVHTAEKHAYSMRSSLKLLEKQLSSDGFLRVHRKAVVNMHKVTELKLSEPPRLILNYKDEIDIAKSRIKEIKNYFSSNKDQAVRA
ncbi:hypothetical protein GWK08_17455 [Leptobacterium flavescens]|uniref:HTH LytTR-type domain-containing protein n=1 Tax=Leptobacterium flavescens TaxID=472055 RepID=A0A6P0UQL1_9FLAO|nr:LytTR family DNA-binding domain-containing protein [Leptobacterium flavescens]NER15247.1 hypothetical protein [Leptobacterium flavescens]